MSSTYPLNRNESPLPEGLANANWGVCRQCGEPVLVDPTTGEMQSCAACASGRSKLAGALGVALLVAGFATVAALIYLCVHILLS